MNNSVEAGRTLAAMEELMEGLKLMSLVTEEVVQSADQLGDVLGEDVCERLAAHAGVVAAWQQAAATPQQLGDQPLGQPAGDGGHPDPDGRGEDAEAAAAEREEELLAAATRSALGLLRALRQSPEAELELTGLQPGPSDAALEALAPFDALLGQVRARLGTTVEEDAARREHRPVLAERHQRARAERLQLEHKLKLHRLERSRQLGELQAVHDAVAAELSALHAESAATIAAAESAAAAEAAANADAFQAQRAAVVAELEAARRDLAALREDSRASAAGARKARRCAEGDCEAAIREYDSEVGARAAELAAAKAAHDELARQIEEVVAETEALRRERCDYEDAQRAATEAARVREARQQRLNTAAAAIQNAWRAWRKQRAAEAKGKGGGKRRGKAPGGGKQATGAKGKGK